MSLLENPSLDHPVSSLCERKRKTKTVGARGGGGSGVEESRPAKLVSRDRNGGIGDNRVSRLVSRRLLKIQREERFPAAEVG